MNSDRDPIAAIATAPGRGGIGIVRLSGADLEPIVRAVLGRAALEPRHATFTRFVDAAGQTIDEGIALLFPAPHSYTGETVLELQGHGGPVVLRVLLARCLEAGRSIGMRLAEPGEFTRRAFLNDRLDLAQAEAVADLIDASTEAAARSAVRSLTGAFSDAVHRLVDGLIELRTLVEATLDFPEEEIDFLEASDARGRLATLRARLDDVFERSRQGALLRDGLHVVLVGSPNVGKSSLLNALAGSDVAIVTAVPGTTRDRIVQDIEIDGVPLVVVDTAGLRETADEIERLGMARTLDAVAQADIVVHLVDVTHPAADEAVLRQVTAQVRRAVPVLTVLNKIDLTGTPPGARDAEGKQIALSAKTGAGLDVLRAELLRRVGWSEASGESLFLARERHLQALQAAREHLRVAEDHAASGDRQLDLFAEELRLAAQRLGEITGEVSADELLGRIFARFCIGK
jgi:tRNA modification GTPase